MKKTAASKAERHTPPLWYERLLRLPHAGVILEYSGMNRCARCWAAVAVAALLPR